MLLDGLMTARLGSGLVFILVAVGFWFQSRLKRAPLPPGPPSEFFLGHLRVIPKENNAQIYAQWAEEYKLTESDVICLKTPGHHVIVLNSLEAARELLDRRAANYSDRPRFTLLEVMGWGRTLTFMPYGRLWQMHRRVLQRNFSNANVQQWHHLQVREARRTAAAIAERPDGDGWEISLRRFAVAVVLKVSYGVDVVADDDPYIQIANNAMFATGNGGPLSSSLVDLFPFVRYLPDWLVRDWPLQFARKWAWAIRKLHDTPFNVAKFEVTRRVDDSNPSLAHFLLRDYFLTERTLENKDWCLDDIKGAAGAVFIAGTDTTWATIVIFVLNMVLHPEIQSKAQKLLDDIVGPDRLPDFKDRASLPYIDDIIQEVYRWSPLAPLGIPHKSLFADTYLGMHIPAGATVLANVHAIAHDATRHADPAAFNPERFSAAGGAEPRPTGHFGFGRRVCVGRFLADDAVWAAVATLLATVEFGKKVRGDGRVVEPVVRYTNGGTCHPERFECVVRPRVRKGV